MCVVVLSRVSTDDDEKNVSAMYSVSRRPFVVDLLANEDTETTAFRSLEEERETTGNVFVRTRKTAVLWEAEASREKKRWIKQGQKKKDLKKDPKSYSKSSFNKGKREKKTVKRKKERGQRTKTEEVE